MGEERADHTGRVLPGKTLDTEDVWITYKLGCVIRLVGHRDRAGGGYLLRSTAVEVPGYLATDGEEVASARASLKACARL
jgi:hypothetical protein